MYWRLFLLRYNEQLLLISSHPLNVPESHVISSIQLEWLFACFTVAQSDRAPPSEDVFLISRRSQLSAAEIRSQSASPLTSHSSLWSTWWCWSASWALARPLFSLHPLLYFSHSHFHILISLPAPVFCHSCKRWPVLGVFSCVIHHLSLHV